MNTSLENSILNLDFIQKGLTLDIISEGTNAVYIIDENAANENGEATVQILEGRSYDYEFSNQDYKLKCSINGIISQTKKKEHRGRIVPNIYVGTLQLVIYNSANSNDTHKIALEVLATKFNNKPDKSYRENYRTMLENITEKCTDLLMQINSPVLQNFETDFNENNETIYQRFCFVSSLINSKEFEEAIQKIISSPKTIWTNEIEQSDIRKIKRFSSNEIRQLTSSSNRIKLHESHFLYSKGIYSIPSKIYSTKKIENIDNAENRFVKHALEVYLSFCEKCFDKFNKDTREKKEAELLVKKLEIQINQPFFNEISRPQSLKLNSPGLQRKSGYREILKTWLMFDLAAKLVWKGGDDVYAAGKKDIATLYEYWLFFALYDLFNTKFKLNNIEHDDIAYKHLIEEDKDSLNVIIKAGVHTALSGVFETKTRNLNVKYSYNRTFKGGKKFKDDKGSGSWTTTLIPDYTLTFWPEGFTEIEAENEELIVHIHFDAKYKVSQFKIKTKLSSKELEEQEEDERKGIYKNADLLKMHAYKDAIRRTGGAYILYPGTKKTELRGFHEIIPGLGAFAINPSDIKIGLKNLSEFIDKVINHLLDRASQRENISNKAYLIYKESKDEDNYLHELLPENLNGNKLIPDETFVLVGYSKTPQRHKWYEEKGKYIFRMDGAKGSLELTNEVVNAKYLLLRRNAEETASELYEIKSKGPKVFSKEYLEKISYPLSSDTKPYYLSIDIEKVKEPEFKNVSFNFKELKRYIEIQKEEKNIYTKKGLPFTVTLTELMNNKI
jgi:hypothetical protein